MVSKESFSNCVATSKVTFLVGTAGDFVVMNNASDTAKQGWTVYWNVRTTILQFLLADVQRDIHG